MKSNFVRKTGFTLIEVMIVVAIISIIAAIALPSYQAQTQNARRADCTGVLTQSRQMMERHYSKNFTYTGAVAGTTFPAKCPVDGDNEYYSVGVTIPDGGASYTLTATAGTMQAGDGCGNLSVNQAGTKTCGEAGCSIDDCW